MVFVHNVFFVFENLPVSLTMCSFIDKNDPQAINVSALDSWGQWFECHWS